MKVQILLVLVAAACATVLSETVNAPYSIIADHLIPLGEKIRKVEERMIKERIVGGSPANLGDLPYQVGTLTNYIGISGTGVCGGAILSPNRVVSAASCWNDGVHQGFRVTLVAGSNTVFTGGNRIDSSVVAMHPSYNISRLQYDISVIYTPIYFTLSANILPTNLPSVGSPNDDFVGTMATASGYGITSDDSQINQNAALYLVNVTVIANQNCRTYFPFIQDSHLCTSGVGGVGTCRGDSGSPLVIGRHTLIGISSFGSIRGCEAGHPSGFTRITSSMDFIRQNLH